MLYILTRLWIEVATIGKSDINHHNFNQTGYLQRN